MRRAFTGGAGAGIAGIVMLVPAAAQPQLKGMTIELAGMEAVHPEMTRNRQPGNSVRRTWYLR